MTGFNALRMVVLALPVLATSVVAACGRGTSDDRSVGAETTAVVSRDTAMLDSIPGCARCTLAIADSVRLGTSEDSIVPARPPGFARDGSGNHYLTFHQWSNQPILRYDPAGRLVGRLARDGRGPGEYEMTSAVITTRGDSLYVIGHGDRIAQLFTADARYVRRAPVAALRVFGVTSRGPEVVYALSGDGESGRRQPWVVRAHGTSVDSFPVFAPVIRNVAKGAVMTVSDSTGKMVPREPRLDVKAALAPDGTVWSYSPVNYRLEQHDTSGKARRLYGVLLPDRPTPVLHAPEFDSLDVAAHDFMFMNAVRGPKGVKALRRHAWVDIDSAGLLWVSTRVPAPRWDTIATKARRLSPLEAPQEETIPAEIEDRRYHTVVDVIDPQLGQLLARLVLPFRGDPVRAGYIGRLTTDDDGYFVPVVYRLRLTR
ncbi:MAG: hypothetical protein V4617_18565 [Gemmatimonadota bacterium]